ncbi:hypothetical protein HT031_004242 [Scenedesmus sp. PABB004]|nr:hypothetical protein HT031_004242 [Scenedesmus sp. PABB004]
MPCPRGRRPGIACLLLACAALVARAQPARPDLLVADLSDCPLGACTPRANATALGPGALAPLAAAAAGDRDACARALPRLAVCADDGSLAVADGGCCTLACAARLQEALVTGAGRRCYRRFLEAACGPRGLRPGPARAALFGAAGRCSGVWPACELLRGSAGDLLPLNATGGLNLTALAAAAERNASALARGGSTAGAPANGSAAQGPANVTQRDVVPPDPFALLPPSPRREVPLATPDEIGAAGRRDGPARAPRPGAASGGRPGCRSSARGARLGAQAPGAPGGGRERGRLLLAGPAPRRPRRRPAPALARARTSGCRSRARLAAAAPVARAHPTLTAALHRAQPAELNATAPSAGNATAAPLNATAPPLNATAANTTAANATAANATFDPALIVANITSDCPVPNVPWPPEQLNTSGLVSALAPLVSAAPPSACSAQATSLATCAFDGTLGVQRGCCSAACAAEMRKLAAQDCLPVVLGLVCNATAEQAAQAEPFVPALLGAATRCANLTVPAANLTCPDGRVLAPAAAAAPAEVPLDTAALLAPAPVGAEPMPTPGAYGEPGAPGAYGAP